MSAIDPTDDPEEWFRENEEQIRREAESDAPDAHVFQSLLESLGDSE